MKYVPPHISLSPKRVHPAIPKRNDRTPFVYFLMKGAEVVYIGRTRSLRQRLSVHNSNNTSKWFDRVRFIKCRSKKLSFYENRWIAKFKPKGNKIYIDGYGLNFIA